MNKQELIDYCNVLKESKSRFINCIDVDRIIETIKQLDEPQKVTIPQFVADWIEHCRGLGYSLYQAMELVHENAEIKKWFIFVDNQDLFALAWIFGYEVEKEKRYLVKVKGVCGNHETLNCEKHSKKWLFSDREENSLYKTKHTRKELEEAGFGEVFNSPVFEVAEVE